MPGENRFSSIFYFYGPWAWNKTFLDPGEKLGELLEGQEKSWENCLSARRKQILIRDKRGKAIEYTIVFARGGTNQICKDNIIGTGNGSLQGIEAFTQVIDVGLESERSRLSCCSCSGKL